MPPLIGWAAARGSLGPGAWVLFAILFLWQVPHFHAISWIYREDYGRAGIKMLPVVEPDGRSTFAQILLCSAALIPVSMLATGHRPRGRALLLFGAGCGPVVDRCRVVGCRGQDQRPRQMADARNGVARLPLLLGLMMFDKFSS